MILDIIIYLSQFCDLKTIINVSLTSRINKKVLENIIQKKLNEIPWRLSIEYNTRNNLEIHNAWLTIGYINSYKDEICNVCNKGTWFKRNNRIMCRTESTLFYSYNLKISVYHGKGINSMIKKLNNGVIPLSVKYDTKKIIEIALENKEGKNVWYDDLIVRYGSFDSELEEIIDIDDNKIFENVVLNRLPLGANFNMLYKGYSKEYFKYFL